MRGQQILAQTSHPIAETMLVCPENQGNHLLASKDTLNSM